MSDGLTQVAGNYAQTGLGVFWAWMFTPTGALLTLLLLGLGGVSIVFRVLGRSVVLLERAAMIAAGLFFVWVVGGILEAWGIPVREWIRQLGSALPDLGSAFGTFLKRLFTTAG